MLKGNSERVLWAAALGFLILAGGAANAASVTVNFDVLPDGTPFAAQTTFAATAGPLREEYAAQGVHFLGGGGVLAAGSTFGVIGTSAPNLLAFNPLSFVVYQDGLTAAPPEQITFDQPADLVKVKVASLGAGVAILTAYDAAGKPVATAQLPLSQVATALEVDSASYNIASVQLVLTGSRSTMTAGDLVFVVQDHVNVPPVTQCALSGPVGANGWFVGDVQATLTATDADDTVVATRCTLDSPDNWQPYAAPVIISGNGTHTLQFQSLDSSSAWEDVKSESVKIDTTRPSVVLNLSCSYLVADRDDKEKSGKKRKDADDTAPVVVSGSAADAISGVAGVTFEVKDEYGKCQPAVTDFGQTIQLQATVKPKAWNGRWYQVTATATNNAGLSSSVSRWVRVLRHWPHHPKETKSHR
jgi:hypothetical protein